MFSKKSENGMWLCKREKSTFLVLDAQTSKLSGIISTCYQTPPMPLTPIPTSHLLRNRPTYFLSNVDELYSYYIHLHETFTKTSWNSAFYKYHCVMPYLFHWYMHLHKIFTKSMLLFATYKYPWHGILFHIMKTCYKTDMQTI